MSAPVLIATWSFATRHCAEPVRALVAGGASLDAVVDLATAVEDDPAVDSVGYGGLPDEGGGVTLDACVMRSPRENGAVCAVARHRHAARLARLVMERTPHAMLAGAGADRFAEECGLPASDLVAPGARAHWERWRRDPMTVDQSRDAGAGYVPDRPFDTGTGGALYGEESGHDTIGALALDRSGVLAGACSTSGTPFKRPGRVGDSPIIGHGLYVDPDVGAVTATGTGELIMGVCGSFLAVETMRRGAAPLDALVTVLERVRACMPLRDVDQVALVALDRKGERAAAALRPGFRWVSAGPGGAELLDPDAVLIA